MVSNLNQLVNKLTAKGILKFSRGCPDGYVTLARYLTMKQLEESAVQIEGRDPRFVEIMKVEIVERKILGKKKLICL